MQFPRTNLLNIASAVLQKFTYMRNQASSFSFLTCKQQQKKQQTDLFRSQF